MSNLMTCGRRGEFDRYASAKTTGELLLAAALMADDIKDLYDLIREGQDAHTYFYAILVLLCLSIALQITSITLAIILLASNYERNGSNASVKPESLHMEATVGVAGSAIGSSDNITIETEPETSPHLRRINDALSAITLVLAVLHVIRNVLDGNYNDVTGGPSTIIP